MEEKDDIFKFEDFLGGNKIDDLKKMINLKRMNWLVISLILII